MQIFKTRLFAKWAKKEKLDDALLIKSINEVEQGLVDADLGGGIFKKRIGLRGKGKRGGARSIIAYKAGQRAFFIFGYPKNKIDNITEHELNILKIFSKELLNYSVEQLLQLINEEKLFEVNYHE